MTEEQYHIIEQYVNGELSNEALTAFEQQLQHDSELAEAVQLFQMMNTEMPALLVNKKGGDDLKKNLQQLSAAHFNRYAPAVPLKKNKSYWLAAAAIAAIAIVSVWVLTKNNEPALYAQYIGDEQISLTSRGNGADDNLAKITSYYNNKEFAKAAPLLLHESQQDTANINYRLLLGRCYIETSDYEKAALLLQPIAAGSSAYKYEAVWLTAMMYLKQNKKSECIATLQTIPADEDLYAKAQQLIQALQQ